MATTAPAVQVSGLVVRYGTVAAVNGVDLHAGKGEVVALLGRNGAGKTSTVEALEGYRRTARDRSGCSASTRTARTTSGQLTRRIGVMLQRGGVYPAMGPAEAVTSSPATTTTPRTPEPCSTASAWRGRRPHPLAPAVGRRAAAALAGPGAGGAAGGGVPRRADGRRRPPGPAGHPRGSGRACGRPACASCLTTHELDEAERMADRIVIIDQGRVVAAGTPAELTTGPESGRTADPLRGPPRPVDTVALGARSAPRSARSGPGEYRGRRPGRARPRGRPHCLAGRARPAPVDLRAGRPTTGGCFPPADRRRPGPAENRGEGAAGPDRRRAAPDPPPGRRRPAQPGHPRSACWSSSRSSMCCPSRPG